MTQSVSLDTRAFTTFDLAPNNSDKRFIVPAGEEWEILSVYVQFKTSATVGDRRIIVGMSPDGNSQLLMRSWAAVTQAANDERFYSFAPGLPLQTSYTYGTGGDLMTPLARMVLKERQFIYIHDGMKIDTTGDDLLVHVTALRRQVGIS